MSCLSYICDLSGITGISELAGSLVSYLYLMHHTSWWETFICMFLKEVSYAPQGCINLIKYTVKPVILWNIITRRILFFDKQTAFIWIAIFWLQFKCFYWHFWSIYLISLLFRSNSLDVWANVKVGVVSDRWNAHAVGSLSTRTKCWFCLSWVNPLAVYQSR